MPSPEKSPGRLVKSSVPSTPAHGVFAGRRSGGTTVVTGRTLDEDLPTVRVLRGPGPDGDGTVAGPAAAISVRAERPAALPGGAAAAGAAKDDAV